MIPFHSSLPIFSKNAKTSGYLAGFYNSYSPSKTVVVEMEGISLIAVRV